MARSPHPFSAPFSPGEARARLQNAILLAGVTMLLAFPTYWYHFGAAAPRIFLRRLPNPEELKLIALGQSIVIFCVALVSAVIGFNYSERLSLPGWGEWRSVPRWLLIGLAVGLVGAWPSWWISDRLILQQAPELEPSAWYLALARMAGIAFTQEVTARFGFLTIGVYLLQRFKLSKSPRPAVFAVSAFTAVGAALTLSRIGIELTSAQFLMVIGFSFAVNWALAEVCLARGLLAAICLHAGLNLKLLIYSFILTGR